MPKGVEHRYGVTSRTVCDCRALIFDAERRRALLVVAQNLAVKVCIDL